LDLRETKQEGSLENYIIRIFTINSAPDTVTVMISEHTKLVGDSGVPREVQTPPPRNSKGPLKSYQTQPHGEKTVKN